ncbi:hypothetical protein L596_011999 [Steinernema carpocapsae]|uniref:CLAVATA3/ESR-like protein n=1 Tax=Steinernema carpocapsae TaxID=34508 RepID=A0A4U5NVQ1_STECR|nr:hypothetical protein L596_011999 [Steinernema carpocapsae]
MAVVLAFSLVFVHSLLVTFAVVACKSKAYPSASNQKTTGNANAWNNESRVSGDQISHPCNDRSGLLPDDPDLKSGRFERKESKFSAYVPEAPGGKVINPNAPKPGPPPGSHTVPTPASKEGVKTKPTQGTQDTDSKASPSSGAGKDAAVK